MRTKHTGAPEGEIQRTKHTDAPGGKIQILPKGIQRHRQPPTSPVRPLGAQ